MERVIYNNYDLDENYPDDELIEMAIESGWIDEEERDEVSDEQLWKWRNTLDECDWDDAKVELSDFFERKDVIMVGTIGRWDGTYDGGMIGEFWDIYWKAIKDCDYIKIYDVNGHFYIYCSHHDGNNFFEVREVTDKGYEYYDRWQYDYGNNKSERYIHNQIIKRYSRLPRFAEKVYGVKAREYKVA